MVKNTNIFEKIKYVGIFRNLLIVVFSLTYCGMSWSQNQIVKKLIEEDRAGHQFYFYPSTLRMLNIDRDPDFYRMVRDIRKLVFFKLRQDRFDDLRMRQIHSELIDEERFDVYMTIEGPDQILFVSGRDNPFETILLAKQGGEYYLADLEGRIDLLYLSRMYQKISERDSGFSDGFINIFDVMGGDRKQDDDRPDNSKDQQTDGEKQSGQKNRSES